jgi:hypothetical protein
MNNNMFDSCLNAYNKSNKLLTTLVVVAGVVIFLQNKKIEKLNNAIALLKRTTGDQTPNA